MSILLPLDVAAPTLAPLPFAIALAGALSTSIVVFHASPSPAPLWMLEALHRLAAPIKAAGLTHHLRLRHGLPEDLICQEALRRTCKWIVLGAGAEPLGHVAASVLGRCNVPTIAVATDGSLRLRSTGEADQLCSVLSTRGSVGHHDDHIALSLVHPPLECAI
jgi:nucleotide-binding universal stress UspA family protein